MAILILILGLIFFVALIVLHELGHAIVAHRNGVKVEEFGIGFPPRLWSRKLKNGTRLSINWLPLGGFVRLKGEHDAATGPGTYGGAHLWVKAKILLAGVVANWLTAIAIFTTLALTGLPQLLPDQFTITADTQTVRQDVIASVVVRDSPAARAGIKEGDRIVQVNGQPVTNSQRMVELTAQNAGKTVPIIYERQGSQQHATITLHKQRTPNQGYAGIAPGEELYRRSTWSAPIVGVGVTAQFTLVTLQGLGATLGHLFHHEFRAAGENVAGPVGIFTILQQSSQIGMTPTLFLIGIISLTLAVMNTLPIPALDGGRLFVTLLFRGLRRALTKRREEAIQTAGMAVLITLVVVITIVDVGRIIGR